MESGTRITFHSVRSELLPSEEQRLALTISQIADILALIETWLGARKSAQVLFELPPSGYNILRTG